MQNENFQTYVTSTAFHLSLSQRMINGLAQIRIAELRPNGEPTNWDELNFTPSRKGLLRRGMIEVDVDVWPYYRITEAGKLALKLCEVAGLVKPYVLRKIKQREAA